MQKRNREAGLAKKKGRRVWRSFTARANFVFAGGEVAPSFVLHELSQLIEVLK
jgi:hypothetical protein